MYRPYKNFEGVVLSVIEAIYPSSDEVQIAPKGSGVRVKPRGLKNQTHIEVGGNSTQQNLGERVGYQCTCKLSADLCHRFSDQQSFVRHHY